VDIPKTLLKAARYFEDLDICEGFMREIKRHEQPPVCPKCGSSRIGEIKTRLGRTIGLAGSENFSAFLLTNRGARV